MLINILGAMLLSDDCRLAIGVDAPDFNLFDQDSVLHTLSDYKNQKLVVYFYPKDNTPGCTKEACSLRDRYSSFKEYNIVTLGISYDTPRSHKKFIEKYSLPFNLLSDSDKKVSRSYCADGWFFPQRKTILIDENGLVLKIIDDVDVNHHAAQILNSFGVAE